MTGINRKAVERVIGQAWQHLQSPPAGGQGARQAQRIDEFNALKPYLLLAPDMTLLLNRAKSVLATLDPEHALMGEIISLFDQLHKLDEHPGNSLMDSDAVMQVFMPDLFQYDVPGILPEWRWIEAAHIFSHRDNVEPNEAWEYIVHIETAESRAGEPVPASLRAIFDEAELRDCMYICFYNA